jgi:cell wall-associated NlpC family hydrolase
MSNIISIVPVTPMRSEPSHRSEQVSQLLFGEAGEVIDTAKDFSKVRCLYDGYEGWCQSSQLAEITAEQKAIKENLLTEEWIKQITINNNPVNIPFGSSLSVFNQRSLSCKNYQATYDGDVCNIEKNEFDEKTVKTLSSKYLNTSYLWGGKSVFGVDCSGFCHIVFKFMNIYLHRDAYQQATQGEGIGFLQEAMCGDLAFFDNEQGRINHVGILLDNSTIIHASGKVRIDSIDNVGIINSETGLRTHNLRVIKRMGNYSS